MPPLTQGVRSENDLEYGQRKEIEEGQQAVGLPKQQTPNVETPPPAASAAALRREGGGGLPPAVTELPSYREMEPGSAGADFGPGPGSDALQSTEPDDPREQYLDYLVRAYSNKDAYDLLQEMRAAKRGPVAQPMAPAALSAPAPVTDESTLEGGDFDAPMEDLPEGDLADEDLEEPIEDLPDEEVPLAASAEPTGEDAALL